MKIKYLIVLIIGIFVFYKCFYFKPTLSTFDKRILNDLTLFKNYVITHKHVISVNGRKDFDIFMMDICDIRKNCKNIDEELAKRLCKYKKNGKLENLVIYNDCVKFNIKSMGNSIIYSEWLELAIINDGNNNDNMLCFNDLFYYAKEIENLEHGWKLILFRKNRNLRG